MLIDWPTAAVVISVIGGAVIIYCVSRAINNSIMERLDRLHSRIASLEEKLLGHQYRLSELEKKPRS